MSEKLKKQHEVYPEFKETFDFSTVNTGEFEITKFAGADSNYTLGNALLKKLEDHASLKTEEKLRKKVLWEILRKLAAGGFNVDLVKAGDKFEIKDGVLTFTPKEETDKKFTVDLAEKDTKIKDAIKESELVDTRRNLDGLKTEITEEKKQFDKICNAGSLFTVRQSLDLKTDFTTRKKIWDEKIKDPTNGKWDEIAKTAVDLAKGLTRTDDYKGTGPQNRFFIEYHRLVKRGDEKPGKKTKKIEKKIKKPKSTVDFKDVEIKGIKHKPSYEIDHGKEIEVTLDPIKKAKTYHYILYHYDADAKTLTKKDEGSALASLGKIRIPTKDIPGLTPGKHRLEIWAVEKVTGKKSKSKTIKFELTETGIEASAPISFVPGEFKKIELKVTDSKDTYEIGPDTPIEITMAPIEPKDGATIQYLYNLTCTKTSGTKPAIITGVIDATTDKPLIKIDTDEAGRKLPAGKYKLVILATKTEKGTVKVEKSKTTVETEFTLTEKAAEKPKSFEETTVEITDAKTSYPIGEEISFDFTPLEGGGIEYKYAFGVKDTSEEIPVETATASPIKIETTDLDPDTYEFELWAVKDGKKSKSTKIHLELDVKTLTTDTLMAGEIEKIKKAKPKIDIVNTGSTKTPSEIVSNFELHETILGRIDYFELKYEVYDTGGGFLKGSFTKNKKLAADKYELDERGTAKSKRLFLTISTPGTYKVRVKGKAYGKEGEEIQFKEADSSAFTIKEGEAIDVLGVEDLDDDLDLIAYPVIPGFEKVESNAKKIHLRWNKIDDRKIKKYRVTIAGPDEKPHTFKKDYAYPRDKFDKVNFEMTNPKLIAKKKWDKPGLYTVTITALDGSGKVVSGHEEYVGNFTIE